VRHSQRGRISRLCHFGGVINAPRH
jgi:hypothetical protein